MLSPSRSHGSKEMNRELVFVLEPESGRVTVEISRSPSSAIKELQGDLGIRVNVNCAKPADSSKCGASRAPENTRFFPDDNSMVWLYRIYHDSVADGPGRRSVVQVAGCSIRCQGCYVPETHERGNGSRVSIARIVDEILENRARHDGVTILGGEPFDQPGPLAELIYRLKRHGLHLTVYTGYTMETLIERRQPAIDYALTHADLLIDGPFVTRLNRNAGEYRGSRNQRFVSIGNPGVKLYSGSEKGGI
ncbi:MAG: 4Fe-4S single cluster domain-containing protein [Pyrinomonadaceae bacterium]